MDAGVTVHEIDTKRYIGPETGFSEVPTSDLEIKINCINWVNERESCVDRPGLSDKSFLRKIATSGASYASIHSPGAGSPSTPNDANGQMSSTRVR